MILYKYYPCSELSYRSISVRGLWCHYPYKMNDPFECLSLSKKEYSTKELSTLREYCRQSPCERLNNIANHADKDLIELFNLLRNNSLSQFAFCSLSEKADSILMWSHYGSSHRGFVIGFDFKNQRDYHFQKVQYCNSLSGFNVLPHLKNLEGCNSDSVMQEIFQNFSKKADCWSYENEWRIWRKSPCYYQFEPSEVKEIYFGVNCDIETKSIILNLTPYLPKHFIFHQFEFGDNPIRLVKK